MNPQRNRISSVGRRCRAAVTSVEPQQDVPAQAERRSPIRRVPPAVSSKPGRRPALRGDCRAAPRPQTPLRWFAGSIGGPAGPPYRVLVGRRCRAAVTSVERQRDVPVLPLLRALHRIKFEAMKRAWISSPARSAGLRPAAARHGDPVPNEPRPLVFPNCCGLQTRAPGRATSVARSRALVVTERNVDS